MTHILIGKTDKGLGPFAIEFDRYVKDALAHLNNPQHYQFLTKQDAERLVDRVQRDIYIWVVKYRKQIGDEAAKFVNQYTSINAADPFRYFYSMYKVHKTPIKIRPVVSDCASVTHPLGKWVDVMLQPIAQGMQTYFKDSFELKKLLDATTVPP